MEQPLEIAAERAMPSGSDGDAAAGEDRLSLLPDDVLVLILLRLGAAAAAGRTSVLSRRWRRVWALLPELRFPASPPPHLVASALAAHEAEAALRYLLVEAEDGAPESAAAWLPAAVRRLSGSLVFKNLAPARNFNDEAEEEEETSKGGVFELPCCERATSVSLDLGCLDLAVPPAGAFARLTELSLRRVRFHGSFELGDAVSSRPCPCLQKLNVFHARGLDSIAIHSESLLQVDLRHLHELRQLTIVAPALEGLQLINCFAHSRPVANISTPQLVFLMSCGRSHMIRARSSLAIWDNFKG
ncbi:hypothetical protein GQ55_2G012300 [Panicum hallii var. hallii]|uniref:F-box domain-containing protein n=1 Tax=Panicum hallii var. hallii TaxID=1504633 RepID=A0A2T7EKB1_9POAL|nr:hypothetical protein GQ55_2G012300 [Panicum hallii var. hallii]